MRINLRHRENIKEQNEERRDLDQKATQEAMVIVENSCEFQNRKSIVLIIELD